LENIKELEKEKDKNLHEFIKPFYCKKCNKSFGNCPWCNRLCFAKVESWN